MNRKQRKLLKKCVKIHWNEQSPLLKGIFIIQRKKLHDSGYRTMYIIGHTKYDRTKKDCEYYLLATFSDVIDFQPMFDKLLANKYDMCDLHLDINRYGTIHIWTNSKKKLICTHSHISNCVFEVLYEN